MVHEALIRDLTVGKALKLLFLFSFLVAAVPTITSSVLGLGIKFDNLLYYPVSALLAIVVLLGVDLLIDKLYDLTLKRFLG
jgi:hypothetical protein